MQARNPTLLLVVDDHAPTRELLTEFLAEAFSDCRLLQADSGEAAVALCRAERPRVVVMDLDMPGMSGIEATRRIRALSGDTRVVIYSLHDTQPYREDAAAAGAAAFVAKSSDPHAIVSAISQLLPPSPTDR
jgi:DNA-binding NarL/FixJ family response regulator